MSDRDWQLFLKDIQECSERVIEYSGVLTREAFFEDRKTLDAVMRNLAIIGEAAKKIPADVRRNYPDVAWKKMAGLRDIVFMIILVLTRTLFGMWCQPGFLN